MVNVGSLAPDGQERRTSTITQHLMVIASIDLGWPGSIPSCSRLSNSVVRPPSHSWRFWTC